MRKRSDSNKMFSVRKRSDCTRMLFTQAFSQDVKALLFFEG
ncbi:hypothetical protein [Lysinibacillus sp. G4S2]|nr:hypothetical protein [Lysinibacillus sp. G4S2]MDM5248654.1 hypothetical protein [Lysinibacillus sp. G4S2]